MWVTSPVVGSATVYQEEFDFLPTITETPTRGMDWPSHVKSCQYAFAFEIIIIINNNTNNKNNNKLSG